MTPSNDTSEKSSSIDRLVQAWQARFTGGLSPASLELAYFDWLLHLGNSPGKQAHLLEEAWRDAMHFATYAFHSAYPQAAPCLEPQPQDQRFTSAEWQHWPFNLLSQSSLLTERWLAERSSGLVTPPDLGAPSCGYPQLTDAPGTYVLQP